MPLLLKKLPVVSNRDLVYARLVLKLRTFCVQSGRYSRKGRASYPLQAPKSSDLGAI